MSARITRESGETQSAASTAYHQAVAHLESVQNENGAFAGEVEWNTMLVCQYVIVRHIVDRPIPEARRQRIRKNLELHVREDGGWGMHAESGTWLFHTGLAYVALRLLGHPADDPLVKGAREWIRARGGLYAIPQWGRVWLAMIGLYPWSGVYPILPELWLLPDTAPAHPRRLYCHMRLIYLGLSYAYGTRYCLPIDARLEALREELYPDGYSPAHFEAHRDEIASTDLFEEPTPGLRLAFSALRRLERFSPGILRERGLARCLEHILFEFESTDYVCLSPVNGQLFCIALFATDPNHPLLERALEGIEYWMWEDDDEGLRICGARSDIWDTSFVLQALCEGPPSEASERVISRAADWLTRAQIQADIPNGKKHYRAPARGGWGFANEKHPWPVSDCTAEALEALIHCERGGEDARLSTAQKLWAIEFVLQRQNDDGGFGSYESRRGNMVLKRFNPAEIYGNCMLEYSYTECTASCIRGLITAREHLGDDLPARLRAPIASAIERARRALLSAQDSNGGWAGFWGVNFTYGTYFAVHGLLACGVDPQTPAIERAVRWLSDHQREDGGWGESWKGMLDGTEAGIPDDATSSVVQTAWALLTLLRAAPKAAETQIDRAAAFLVDRQRDDGSWPSEDACGVFFNTAVLDYRLYRQEFPAWALGRYASARAT